MSSEEASRASARSRRHDGPEALPNLLGAISSDPIDVQRSSRPRQGQSEEEQHPQVVIFVNKSSGGGRAGQYLSALGGDGRPHDLRIFKGVTAEVRAFDIREGQTATKPGFLMLKAMCGEATARRPVRVMVAGGDGTVMWAISEMVATGIDLDHVAVGHIPFGTGNDFSRSTGWGPCVDAGDLLGTGWQRLKRDVRRWVASDIINFDVWEVDVTAGGFAFVHGGQRGLTETDKVQHGLTELEDGRSQMRKPMVNYFSLGQCCRAGLGFEKRRTSSRFGNNLRYALEGLKKLTFRPAPMVSDVVRELSVGGSFSTMSSLIGSSTASLSSLDSDVSAAMCNAESRSTCSSLNHTTSTKSFAECKERAAELLFLNIPSFAGGADPWAWSGASPGQEGEELKDVDQAVGDGRLEVVSYSSGLGAAIDAANGKVWTPGRGAGQRVASAEGPFRMSFLSPDQAKYTSTDGRVYFQVDGEFFVAHQPEEVNVQHWKTVKVMRRSCQDTSACRCWG